MDHEPAFIGVWPVRECQFPGRRNVLTYEPEFDPMLYFWPVEGQHVIVFLRNKPEESGMRRLVRALERDGADLVTVTWQVERTLEERREFGRDWTHRTEVRHFGDVEKHLSKFLGSRTDEAVAASGPG